MTCNDIDWLVDVLGTMDFLQAVINDEKTAYVVEDISERSPKKSAFKSKKRGSFKGAVGLYFMDGHWYSYKGGVRKDSYTEDYQIKGTAHFCQTFATLIFLGYDLGSYQLAKGKYADNIRAAMKFWIEFFGENKELAQYIVDEVKSPVDAESKPNIYHKLHPKLELEKFTVEKLIKFLNQVYANADTFVPCEQG